jgi:hypothetical protein
MSKVRIVLAEREEGKIVKRQKALSSKIKSETKEATLEEGKASATKKSGKILAEKAKTNVKARNVGFAKKTFQRKAV